jgi:hypothetical protein
MADNDFLRQTLTHYREQRQRILEQLRPVDLIIQQLEGELGEPPDSGTVVDISSAFPQPPSDGGLDRKPPANGKRLDLRGDEFFGMSQGDAARAYVTKVGHAVELDELLQALGKGGCHVGGADPSRTLYIALIRNTRDFVKLPNGLLGLRSMYPGLKPGQATAGKPKDKAKKTKRKSGKKKAAAKASTKRASKQAMMESPETPPVKQSAPVKATVKEVLADGQLLSGDEIVHKVQEKIGTNAKSFTIYGILKNEKDFEKVGEQFRLRTIKEEAQATSA